MLIDEDWDKSKEINTKNAKTTSNKPIEQLENITIYPNPTTGIFSLKLDSSPSKIEITDITGKIIYSDNNIVDEIVKIDISTEREGIYILRIETEEGIITNKLIK